MKCRIKKNNSYFNKNIGFQNHWTYRDEAKTFDSVEDARKTIKLYKIKNVEIEKIKGNRK
jgi:hypothetical protein